MRKVHVIIALTHPGILALLLIALALAAFVLVTAAVAAFWYAIALWLLEDLRKGRNVSREAPTPPEQPVWSDLFGWHLPSESERLVGLTAPALAWDDEVLPPRPPKALVMASACQITREPTPSDQPAAVSAPIPVPQSLFEKANRAEHREEKLAQAVDAVNREGLSVRKAARLHQVPESTLRHRLKQLRERAGEPGHLSRYCQVQAPDTTPETSGPIYT